MEQPGSPEQTPSSGELIAAISNAVVRIYAEHHGRGPTRAKTYLFDDAVLTVMEESAAAVERTLAKAGDEQLVRDIRNACRARSLTSSGVPWRRSQADACARS